MPEAIQNLVSEAKRNRFSTISKLSEDDIISVWESVSEFVEIQMRGQKGVHISNLGTFTFVHNKMDIGNNKFILLHRPVFVLSEKLAQTHAMQYTKYHTTGEIPVVQLNFTVLATETPFDRDIVKSCVLEVLQVLSRAVAGQQSVEFLFRGIGALNIRDSRVKMKFFKDFLSSMDGSGNLLRVLANEKTDRQHYLLNTHSNEDDPVTMASLATLTELCFAHKVCFRPGFYSRKFQLKDPFIELGDFTMDPPAVFADHPHRGFESVTYMLKGDLVHEDSLGNNSKVTDGDIQNMNTGRGITHSESIGGKDTVEGINIWVNIPQKDKMCQAAYDATRKADQFTVKENGVTLDLLMGSLWSSKAKIQTQHETLFLNIELLPGASHVQKVTNGWTTIIYTLSGRVEASYVKVGERVLGYFGPGDFIQFRNSDKVPARLLLLSGKPLSESVIIMRRGWVAYVATSQKLNEEAEQDFLNRRNGFEDVPKELFDGYFDEEITQTTAY